MQTSRTVLKADLIAAGIYEDYHNCSLTNYRGPEEVRKALKGYIMNLEDMRDKGGSFFMWGKWNLGKTTAGMILGKAYLINDYPVP